MNKNRFINRFREVIIWEEIIQKRNTLLMRRLAECYNNKDQPDEDSAKKIIKKITENSRSSKIYSMTFEIAYKDGKWQTRNEIFKELQR